MAHREAMSSGAQARYGVGSEEQYSTASHKDGLLWRYFGPFWNRKNACTGVTSHRRTNRSGRETGTE